jgi:chemotaxis signal transduction protein
MIPKVALLSYGDQGYALPVESMEHILPSPQVHVLPQMHRMFSGVFVHGEHVVPLFKLLSLLKPGKTNGSEDLAFVVLFLTEFGTLGLPASQVQCVVDRATGKVESLAENKGSRVQRAFVLDGKKFPLLDATSLLAFMLGGDENTEEA